MPLRRQFEQCKAKEFQSLLATFKESGTIEGAIVDRDLSKEANKLALV